MNPILNQESSSFNLPHNANELLSIRNLFWSQMKIDASYIKFSSMWVWAWYPIETRLTSTTNQCKRLIQVEHSKRNRITLGKHLFLSTFSIVDSDWTNRLEYTRMSNIFTTRIHCIGHRSPNIAPFSLSASFHPLKSIPGSVPKHAATGSTWRPFRLYWFPNTSYLVVSRETCQIEEKSSWWKKPNSNNGREGFGGKK